MRDTGKLTKRKRKRKKWRQKKRKKKRRGERRRRRNVETDTFLFSPSFPPLLLAPCIFLGDLICLSERENQFMMTIGGPVMKAAQFRRHGKVLPANLGKMNHSHFIWTSVLTPPTSSTPLPHSSSSRSHSHSLVTGLLGLLQVGQQECSVETLPVQWRRVAQLNSQAHLERPRSESSRLLLFCVKVSLTQCRLPSPPSAPKFTLAKMFDFKV